MRNYLTHHGLQMAKVIVLSLVLKPLTPEPEGHDVLLTSQIEYVNKKSAKRQISSNH